MGIKTCAICFLAAALIGGGAYGVHRYLASSAESEQYVTDLSSSFNADKETAEALALYQKDSAPRAKILKPSGGGKAMYLYFCGLPDRPSIEKITDCLEEENWKAVFFAEGQNALDEEEGMKVLQKRGQVMGNYTWLGRPKFETMGEEAALSSICRTQKAIHLMEGSYPLYFKAPNTKYTDRLLKELGAAGISYAVESTLTIRRGEIKSLADAEALVKKIKPGSFIAFEVNRSLDIKTHEAGDYDEKPAIDKKPTVKDEEYINQPKTAALAEEVEWLLHALKAAGYEVKSLPKE